MIIIIFPIYDALDNKKLSVSHCYLGGRHLSIPVVDIDLGSKSDIYFIAVTLICIDYFGFSN